MYKVFVNDKPIIITSSVKNRNNFDFYPYKNISFKEILHRLKTTNTKGIILYTSDLEDDWINFTNNLTTIPAAGGLVTNKEKEILFIFRNNTWDLPKGWIEKGESIENAAIREVEEECGISNLTLIKPLLTTYHIYNQNGLNLKKTYWFLMSSDDTRNLTPQLEEGITKVIFKNDTETKKALENTYKNIKLVYDTYKQS